jgi:hypothetical protein
MLSKDTIIKIAHECGVDLDKVGYDQFVLGLKSETEHKNIADLITSDKLTRYVIYGMIAAAHFKEDPNYYHKLLAAGLS